MIAAVHETVHAWLAASTPGMRDHIVFSTLVLVALLALSLLPILRPRTRYALVLLGVAKFFVPAAMFSRLAQGLAIDEIAPHSFAANATQALGPAATTDSEWLCIFAAVWVAGSLIVTARMLAVQRQWRGVVRLAGAVSARETEAMRRVADRSALRRVPRVARSTSGHTVTTGIVHPVVLLPDSCADRLNDDELSAVLAHELTHVERRHNLAALFADAVLTVFWFHPVLWIAGHRLRAESEKDCDEQVLGFVSDPPTYLSGMLKVCRGFIATRPAGAACMSTTRLKERMDHLMRHHESPTHSVPHRLAIATGIAAVLVTTLLVSAGETANTSGKDATAAREEGIEKPKVISKVEPKYPPLAKENKVQGMVVVAATIDMRGNVTKTSIAQGVEGEGGEALETAAAEAVKQWKFEPARKNGKAVVTTFKVTINFRLE